MITQVTRDEFGKTTQSILRATLENLAEHIAAARGGRVRANDLLPYLPVSLSMVQRHLDEMVDGSVVTEERLDGIKTYLFSEMLDSAPKPMPVGVCMYCGSEAPVAKAMQLCYACNDELCRELLRLAETTAWPSEAVWQHELVYLTASASGQGRGVAEVSGRSRMTLKTVKSRLEELAAAGFARQELDDAHGVVRYALPPLEYRREAFERHDEFIHMHPSSLKDELEIQIIKSLGACIGIVFLCFLGSLVARIPFPILIVGGVVLGFFVCRRIFRQTTPIGLPLDED